MIVAPAARPFFVRAPSAEYINCSTALASGSTWGNGNTCQITWAGPSSLKVEWWDGTTTTYAGTLLQAGSPNYYYAYPQKAVSTAGTKNIKMYPVTSDGLPLGFVWFATFAYTNVSNRAPITSINVRNCPSLGSLYIDNSPAITSIDITNMKSLTGVTVKRCTSASLTSLDVSGCTALNTINITSSTNIASINGISSTANSLNYLVARGAASLNNVNLNGFTNLLGLDFAACSGLTSLRMVNVALGISSVSTFTSYYYYVYAYNNVLQLNSTGLGGAALDQVYNDLANGAAIIIVKGAAGAGSDTPAIATSKGYSVLGS